MKLCIQRVSRASVSINQQVSAQIGYGLLVFLGIHHQDDDASIPFLADKLVHLRIFSDEAGKMNRSLQDVGGEILIVSQFTLYADCSKGRRPSFTQSAQGEKARWLYEEFAAEVGRLYGESKVKMGTFGADMEVSLTNDGPATFELESKK